MPRPLAAGNWKMNGTGKALTEIERLAAGDLPCDVVIAPPATLLARAADVAGDISLSGQDCHAETAGAHTGDISAEMLKEAGASHVILGHSERRADHGETDVQIKEKVKAAHGAGLTAIVCIGETLADRDAERTLDVLDTQLAGSLPDDIAADSTVIAYEPVWAIGTGKVPTLDQIEEVHSHIRDRLAARFGKDTARDMRLLYGGSVKPSNALDIFGIDGVNGALVGGASLKAADFRQIIDALAAAKT